jgi:[acyl-carrier-protein] S-malonyltransferase
MTRALVFPGQGSQAVGMGRDLAGAFRMARDTFQEIDEALQQNLSRLMFEGPEADLVLTENAQPALMAVSLAVMRVLEREAGLDLRRHAAFVAGHSLGEYSALAAARSLSLADTARLLKRRGLAMQRAVPVGTGAMAALMGLELDRVREVAEEAAEGQVCAVANDNGAGQVVVSGDKAAVERAAELAKTKGTRHVVMLPVSAPFHCALMQPAQDRLAADLAAVVFGDPAFPVAANVTATLVTSGNQAREALVAQVTGAVRWVECVQRLLGEGTTHFVEVGPGKVLSGLMRQIQGKDAATVTLNVEDSASLEKALLELGSV